MAVALTMDNFEKEVLKSEIPVIVDFWAAWCGPCNMIAPEIDKLEAEFSGKIKFAKLNVDECPPVAMQFGASAIPMLGYFEGGSLVKRAVGAMPAESIKEALGLK